MPKAKTKKTNYRFFWKDHILPSIVLMAVTIALYASTAGFDYVLDDVMVVTENKFTQKGLGGLKEIFTEDSFRGYTSQENVIAGGRYRPLSIASFALENHFFGNNKMLSHIFNVLLYLLNALLLYRIMWQLPKLRSKNSWFLTLPFIVTLVFVVHPLHTEAVANIKGRDEILSAIGGFGALYFTLKYLKTKRIVFLVGSGIALFLGMLSKENAITFLAVIPLTLYFFFRPKMKTVLNVMLPLLASAAIFFAIRYQIVGFQVTGDGYISDLMNNPFVEMNTSQKMATILYTIGYYLKLLFFPYPLTHDYYPYHIPIMNWTDIWVLVSLLAISLMALSLPKGFKEKWIIAYGILFFGITHSITSNILFPVGTFMNERFMYIPLFSVCLVVPYILIKVLPKKNTFFNNTIKYILVYVVIISYALLTAVRVPAWKDKLQLNKAAIKVSTNSARANCFYGVALFEEFQTMNAGPEKDQKLRDASFHINKALQIYPKYGSALTMYSGVLAEEFKIDRNIDQLLAGFERVLLVKPNVGYVYTYLEYLNGRGNYIPELVQFYKKMGFENFYAAQKNKQAALKLLNYALTIQPNDDDIRNMISTINN